jgi:hypothetical protein
LEIENEAALRAIESLADSAVLRIKGVPLSNANIKTASIEFAHTYTDEIPGVEQAISCKVASRISDALLPDGWTIRSEVLLDDYNVTETITTAETLRTYLDQFGHSPDFVASEASLVPAATELIQVPGRARASARRFLEQRGIVPCSALVAAWEIMRLESRQPPESMFLFGSLADWDAIRPQVVIQVLPTRYSEVELQADPIIVDELGTDGFTRLIRVYHPSEIVTEDPSTTFSQASLS